MYVFYHRLALTSLDQVSLCASCVRNSGQGGFATLNLMNAVDWAVDNSPPYQWRTIPPVEAIFLTITVSGPTERFFTSGAYDPEIPAIIARSIRMWNAPREGTQPAQSALRRVEFWEGRAEYMHRGGTEAWWAIQPPLDANMEYQCDKRLGTPVAVDCAQIEWSQLNSSIDTLNIGPGVLFLHSKTCFLAISAAIPLVITWAQIRVAVSSLMNLCIEGGVAQGGRAYYQQPSQISGRNSKYKRQAGNISGLSGLNALPPHLNVTIFEQSEPWNNPINELTTCTWKAVLSGKSVISCNSF